MSVNEQCNEKQKIAFFVKEGNDTFLNAIIEALSSEYDTKKVVIPLAYDFSLIDKWMEWANICWFEWCDELVIYGSHLELAAKRTILCRLHSYEAFTYYPTKVQWDQIDTLIFVADHIRQYVIETFGVKGEKAVTIPNGVNMDLWEFKNQTHGFHIAYVGYINYKKGPLLLLQAFESIHRFDPRYKLFIAGEIQDPRYTLYFKQMIKELSLENHIFFEGWQHDLNAWLNDKHYILCCSVLESQNMSVMQAMAKGIRPLIHNFVGAKSIYSEEMIWNSVHELPGMLHAETYDSNTYRNYIDSHYSLKIQFKKINDLLHHVTVSSKSKPPSNMSKPTPTNHFNYNVYWNQRLNSNFSIESVGYWGLGTLYNQLLYKKRVDMLDLSFSKLFSRSKKLRILELGPGTGIFTDFFKDKGVSEYHAIDITKISTEKLTEKYPYFCFIHGDISEAQNYHGPYDLIFASNVLLHITSEDKFTNTIKNISEHLKSDGYCILLDPISIINAKSESQHVIIRDQSYIENVLQQHQLHLYAMLPLFYFMNYPFDRAILKTRAHLAYELFNCIGKLFLDTSISNDEKQLIGSYLIDREKQIIHKKGYGLSEKFLIIQKADPETSIQPSSDPFIDIEATNTTLESLRISLASLSLQSKEYLETIDSYLLRLESE